MATRHLPDLDFKDWVEGKLQIPEMEPLRTWIEAEPDLFIGNLAAATVFTTGTPATRGQKMIEAVAALPEPTFNDDAVVCDTGVISPCDDGLSEDNPLHFRKCSSALPIYHQIHGTYQNPVWQQGTRPYRISAEGGTIEYNADGLPLEQPRRQCAILSRFRLVSRCLLMGGQPWFTPMGWRFLLLDVLRWNCGAAHAAWLRGFEL